MARPHARHYDMQLASVITRLKNLTVRMQQDRLSFAAECVGEATEKLVIAKRRLALTDSEKNKPVKVS